MLKNREGFVYLLVIAAVLAAVVFSLTLSNLNQGFRKQVSYVAHKDVCFEMAYSVLSGIMAKVYSKPWNERFFATAPVSVNGESILDGTYDFLVEDSPGKSHQFDTYIRINLLGQRRVFFWRIEYHDNMLDISQSFSKIYFTHLDEDKFPAGAGNRITTEVDRILKNRELNREKSEKLASILKGSNNSKDIADLLNAPKPTFPDNDFPDFNPLKPKAPEVIETPSILAPPISEQPKDPGQPVTTPDVNEVDHKKEMDDAIKKMKSSVESLESANETSGTPGSGAMGQANSALGGGYDASVFSNMASVVNTAQEMLSSFAQDSPGSDALLEMAKVGAEYIDQATAALDRAIALNEEIINNYLDALAAMGDPSEMSDEQLAEYQALVEEYQRQKAINDKIIEDGKKMVEEAQAAWDSYLQGLIDKYPSDPGWQEFAAGQEVPE